MPSISRQLDFLLDPGKETEHLVVGPLPSRAPFPSRTYVTLIFTLGLRRSFDLLGAKLLFFAT
jgi:hypothetical protein